ncbi:NAD(P)-binding domain-containing protein [Ruegeria sp. R13_0]|uniref:NADPH-dependent F420 reductase n=1 Tax=Ruegeria sp. R13_0 TaxID=2821099 RepID=UPI001AD95A4B|nr:NAD(P)-binding domain-containing protein [Ruegeria sp. R13_0]MBO9436941.1 NAD(P)-binding domain-containing protein [Ruegeria sp. R13_0]
MNIGIIGAGDIGRLYAKLWHQAGHAVFLSARDPNKHRAFVEALGDRAFFGTPEDAAAFGDVVLLAVNYPTVENAIEAITPHVIGKLVIDATNPLGYDANGKLEALIPDGEIAGLVMAEKLPNARIGKAFTSLWSGYVETKSNVADPQVAMPFAVNLDVDKTTMKQLIREAGLVPVDIGGLADSAALDPSSPVWNVVLTPDEVRQRVATYRQDSAA